MKYLNQLVCVALFLSCLQAFRSYMHAAPAPVTEQKLKVGNGTDWQMRVLYTTPQGVSISDTIAPHGSLAIVIKPDSDVSYSLEKEQGKIKTDIRKVPAPALAQATFEVTPESIKELIAAALPPVVVSPAQVSAAVAHAAAPAIPAAPTTVVKS